jgi:hypothetical protein
METVFAERSIARLEAGTERDRSVHAIGGMDAAPTPITTRVGDVDRRFSGIVSQFELGSMDLVVKSRHRVRSAMMEMEANPAFLEDCLRR